MYDGQLKKSCEDKLAYFSQKLPFKLRGKLLRRRHWQNIPFRARAFLRRFFQITGFHNNDFCLQSKFASLDSKTPI
jgi:hypothetical protein